MRKVKLKDICEVLSVRGDVDKLPYLEIGDIDLNTKSYKYKNKKSVKGCKKAFKNDIVISNVRPTRGAMTKIIEDEIEVSSGFTILRQNNSLCVDDYIYSILRNNKDFYKYCGEKATGTTYPTIKTKDILEYEVPLPSKEEQLNIVNSLKLVYENIGWDIEGKIADLKALKKSAIDKAIRGLLTSQNDCESAEELYQSIQEEKERLIKEGKIKKSKKEEIKEIPFEIPKNWKWCRLGEIADIVMGQSPKGNELNENNIGMEFHQGKSNFGYKFIEKSNVCTNNILKIAKSNSILLSVRAPVGVLNITNREICLGRGLCGIFSIKSNQNFLWYSLNKMNELLIKKGVGTIFDSVTSEDVRNLPIPLPPLEEQERIVEILSAIDSAIDSAIEVQEDNQKLLNSLLNEFLNLK